jgi:hypothetical protein
MSSARRLFAGALVPVLIGVGSLAAASSVGAATKVGLMDCSHKIAQRPATYPLSCGDGNIGLLKVKWTSFGGSSAKGTGSLAVNGCDPNCAAGKTTRTSVTIVATKPKTINGKRTYSRIALTGASGKPAGRYGVNKYGPYTLEG